MRNIKILLYVFSLLSVFCFSDVFAKNEMDKVIVNIPNTITGVFSSFENYGSFTGNTISYRTQDSIYKIKMPQIATMGNIALFNGIFINSESFWTFYNNIKMNTIKRENITVKYYVNDEKKVMVLNNAWPTKIDGFSIDPFGNVLVSGMEIAYEITNNND